MKISESNIELNVTRYAMQTGWWAAKFTSQAKAHVPDRIYIKNGKSIFIEFKATGCKPRPAQLARFKEMEKYGAVIYVVDDIAQGKEVLDVESK